MSIATLSLLLLLLYGAKFISFTLKAIVLDKKKLFELHFLILIMFLSFSPVAADNFFSKIMFKKSLSFSFKMSHGRKRGERNWWRYITLLARGFCVAVQLGATITTYRPLGTYLIVLCIICS